MREIGHLALAFAGMMTLISLHSAAVTIVAAGDISPNLIWIGVRNLTIAPIYALIVYSVSLIIRIIRKPKK